MGEPARLLRGPSPKKSTKKRSHPSEWRGFGYDGAEQETCLWCGTRLLRSYTYDPGVSLKRGTGAALNVALGPYEDGYFCSMRCGYQFGARCAQLGDRLG